MRFDRALTLLSRNSLLEVYRNYFGLVLLCVIPPIFLLVVDYTTPDTLMPIRLVYEEGGGHTTAPQRVVSLVFMALGASGFLSAYFALILFQAHRSFFKYCVFIGLRPGDFVLARSMVFLLCMLIVSAITVLLLVNLADIENLHYVIIGMLLINVVYGTYGALVGVLTNDFMVGVLGVVLLCNLDVGWLQNPAFFAAAAQPEVIEVLPAFYPSQFALGAAFGGGAAAEAAYLSGAYSLVFLAATIVVLKFRFRGLAVT